MGNTMWGLLNPATLHESEPGTFQRNVPSPPPRHDVGRRAELARRARVYYADHRHDVIAHKTLVKTRTIGRIPRGATMLEHNITTDQVREALAEYMDTHPDTRAAKRAKLWLCHAADLDTCGLESCASSDESLETHD